MTKLTLFVALIVAACALTAASDDVPVILVSRQLAESARLRVGETVTIAADAAGRGGRTFRVSGIYEPTPDPMKFTARRIEARMHLPDVLDVMGPRSDADTTDAVDAINVRLTDPK